jgi:hypothetical protein
MNMMFVLVYAGMLTLIGIPFDVALAMAMSLFSNVVM